VRPSLRNLSDEQAKCLIGEVQPAKNAKKDKDVRWTKKWNEPLA
jgi:hypothetical protein